jgi:hypothetical protein
MTAQAVIFGEGEDSSRKCLLYLSLKISIRGQTQKFPAGERSSLESLCRSDKIKMHLEGCIFIL